MAEHKESKHNVSNRRKSFSGFSPSYTGGLNGNQQSYSEKMRRRTIVKRALIVAGIITLFILAFLFMDVMLNISQKPVDTASAFITPNLPFLFCPHSAYGG